MRWVYRVVPTAASLTVGAASFALSYVALRDVAARVGAVPPYLAFLVPVVIDGGVICGSTVIWAAAKERRRELFPFLFVAALVVVSVVVNVAHAGPQPLAKAIAALPPLVLLGTLELVAAQHRRPAEPSDAAAGFDPARPAPAGSATVPTVATAKPAAAKPAAAKPAAATGGVQDGAAARADGAAGVATPGPRPPARPRTTLKRTPRVSAELPADAFG